MSEEQGAEQPEISLEESGEIRAVPKKAHWPSIAQFGCGSLAVLAAFGGAGVLVFSGVFQWFDPLNRDLAVQSFALAMGGVLVGVLSFASVGFSFSKVFHVSVQTPVWWPKVRQALHPRRLVFLIPLGVGVGYLISQGSPGVRLILPIIHVVLITVMAAWLVWIGARKLPMGSGQRAWGVVGVGLVLGPMILMVLEILAVVIGVIFLAFRMSNDPNILNIINRIAYYIEQWASNPSVVNDIQGEVLNQPEFLVAGIVFLALVVPMLEEFVKPIGVWFLIGRRLSPKEGFVLGLMSGAAYGLFENIIAITPDETWAAVATARLGTSVMHIMTSGLVGWGIVSARKERRILRFFGAYFLAVMTHGAWNGAVVLTAFASFQVKSPIVPAYMTTVGPTILIMLTIGAFIALVVANRKLRNQSDNDTFVVEDGIVS